MIFFFSKNKDLTVRLLVFLFLLRWWSFLLYDYDCFEFPIGETENGSRKRFQRVEILKIAEPCPLIDPSQVLVTQGQILMADPVLTPIGTWNSDYFGVFCMHYKVSRKKWTPFWPIYPFSALFAKNFSNFLPPSYQNKSKVSCLVRDRSTKTAGNIV